jgi:hypothetical protein
VITVTPAQYVDTLERLAALRLATQVRTYDPAAKSRDLAALDDESARLRAELAALRGAYHTT